MTTVYFDGEREHHGSSLAEIEAAVLRFWGMPALPHERVLFGPPLPKRAVVHWDPRNGWQVGEKK